MPRWWEATRGTVYDPRMRAVFPPAVVDQEYDPRQRSVFGPAMYSQMGDTARPRRTGGDIRKSVLNMPSSAPVTYRRTTTMPDAPSQYQQSGGRLTYLPTRPQGVAGMMGGDVPRFSPPRPDPVPDAPSPFQQAPNGGRLTYQPVRPQGVAGLMGGDVGTIPGAAVVSGSGTTVSGGGGYGGAAYGGAPAMDPQQQEWLNKYLAAAGQPPMDIDAVMNSKAYKAMEAAAQAAQKRAMSDAKAGLAAAGVLGPNSTPASEKFAEVGDIYAKQLAGMIPQLVNTQLVANKQGLDTIGSGLRAIQDTQGWALDKEYKEADLTGQFRGGATLTKQRYDNQNALGWYNAQTSRINSMMAKESANAKVSSADLDSAAKEYQKSFDVTMPAARAWVTVAQGIDQMFLDWQDSGKQGDPPSVEEALALYEQASASLALRPEEDEWIRLNVLARFQDPEAAKALNNLYLSRKKGTGSSQGFDENAEPPDSGT